MVNFNELRITEEKGCMCLLLDASVSPMAWFDDVVITDVWVESAGKALTDTAAPSSKAWHLSVDSRRSVSLALREAELGIPLGESLVLVYIGTGGTPAPDTPCGLDRDMWIGAVWDRQRIFRTDMALIKGIVEGKCAPPAAYAEHILRLKALELSVRYGDWAAAAELWHRYFARRRKADRRGPWPLPNVFDRPCGCGGGGQ